MAFPSYIFNNCIFIHFITKNARAGEINRKRITTRRAFGCRSADTSARLRYPTRLRLIKIHKDIEKSNV